MNRLGLVIGLAMWTGVAIAAGPVLGPGSAWTSVAVPPPIGIAIPTAKDFPFKSVRPTLYG